MGLKEFFGYRTVSVFSLLDAVSFRLEQNSPIRVNQGEEVYRVLLILT